MLCVQRVECGTIWDRILGSRQSSQNINQISFEYLREYMHSPK